MGTYSWDITYKLENVRKFIIESQKLGKLINLKLTSRSRKSYMFSIIINYKYVYSCWFIIIIHLKFE